MFSAASLLALTLTMQGAPATPVQSEADAPPPDRPIHRLFQNLGRDIVALPSSETLLLVGAGVGGALAVHPVDDNLHDWADPLAEPGYAAIGGVGGDGWIQGGAALGTYGLGLLADNREVIHVGSDLIRAQLLNAVLTRGLKLAAGRDRPSGGGESLPSGHASATFATASVLASHYGAKAAIPAYAAAAFVGWTRVRDDVHWLSDVVLGSAVGIIAGRTVARGHGPQSWAIVPVAGPRHVALQVTYLGKLRNSR